MPAAAQYADVNVMSLLEAHVIQKIDGVVYNELHPSYATFHQQIARSTGLGGCDFNIELVLNHRKPDDKVVVNCGQLLEQILHESMRVARAGKLQVQMRDVLRKTERIILEQ